MTHPEAAAIAVRRIAAANRRDAGEEGSDMQALYVRGIRRAKRSAFDTPCLSG
jgi:hypothetical protein